MSAVSNSVTPRSLALWITLREVSRSVRWPKLLQPRPTAETRRPEPPRLRSCMDQSCNLGYAHKGMHCDPRLRLPQAVTHRASMQVRPVVAAAVREPGSAPIAQVLRCA